MKVDDQLILQLEELARLALEPAERTQLRAELEAILDMMEMIQQVNTDGVEPLRYLVPDAIPLREDKSEPGWTAEEATRAAKTRHENFFVLPAVLKLSNENGQD